MNNKQKYKKPLIEDIGSAKELIQGGPFNKETGGADGLLMRMTILLAFQTQYTNCLKIILFL